MKERNESLDCLKGIAILLVMFGHVQVHNHMTDPYLYDVIKSIQMPMFFLISGYLAGTGKKITNLEQYRKKIGRRAVAYLLPFFSWLVVQHMTYVPQALRTVLFQLDYGLWFLIALFLFTVLCYTAQLLEAVTEKEIAFWAVWLTGCCVILVSYLAGVTFLSPSILIIYLPYYTVAYLVGRHREFVETYAPASMQRWIAGLCAVVFLVMIVMLDLVTVTGIGMLGVQTAASFLGCFWLIRMVLDWKTCELKRKLSKLGTYTLEIYVIHYQFATVLNPDKTAYAFWSVEGLLYAAAAFVAMSVITGALIYIIDYVKPLRFLLFGKSEKRSGMENRST